MFDRLVLPMDTGRDGERKEGREGWWGERDSFTPHVHAFFTYAHKTMGLHLIKGTHKKVIKIRASLITFVSCIVNNTKGL